MKFFSKTAIALVVLSIAALVYLRSERKNDDSTLISGEEHQTPADQATFGATEKPNSEIASRPATPVEKSEEKPTLVAKAETEEEHLQTANAAVSESDSFSDDGDRRQNIDAEGTRKRSTRPFANEMKLISPAEKSAFLAKNALGRPENWKQHVILTASQIEETLRGHYLGVIRGGEKNLKMKLNIDGTPVNDRFMGELVLELTDESGRVTGGDGFRANLAHYVRAVKENGAVSIVIGGESQSDRAHAVQLFFNNEDPAEVIGNFYSRQNGHLTLAGEISLQKTDPNAAEKAL